MNITFWMKTFLYNILPNRYGYWRSLQRYADPEYVHQRDKHPVRNKHHGQGGWKQKNDGTLNYRDYADYDEYVIHQKQKFDEILKIKGGFSKNFIFRDRLKFYARFKNLQHLLPPTASIICLGARQGTEVEVFRDLGFKKAYGIDLNPGPNNPYVREGDFMNIDTPTTSIDLLYTNCVDHAFNLEQFFTEHARVIKENGYALYDIACAEDVGGAFEAVSWDSEEAIFTIMLRYFKRVVRVETEGHWKWILMQGKRDLVAEDQSL